MAIRYYQNGDYDNTIERKLLENESATLDGAQTISLGPAGGSAAPRYYADGDYNNTILRKLLENQSGVIAGRMTFHFS
jgi:hypothetical protein